MYNVKALTALVGRLSLTGKMFLNWDLKTLSIGNNQPKNAIKNNLVTFLLLLRKYEEKGYIRRYYC